MEEPLIIILQFQDGLYPEIESKAYKSNNPEIVEMVNFFNNLITRANFFKEEKNYYPPTIEKLIEWEKEN